MNIQIQGLLKCTRVIGKKKKNLCKTALLLQSFLGADPECYCSVKVHFRKLIFYLAKSCVATRLQTWTPLKIYCGKY